MIIGRKSNDFIASVWRGRLDGGIGSMSTPARVDQSVQLPREQISPAGFGVGPILPIVRRSGRGSLRSSRLSFPADKATSRCGEVRACPQRVLVNDRLPRRFRLRVAEEQFVGQLHLLPGTLLPQRNFWNSVANPLRKSSAVDRFGSK